MSASFFPSNFTSPVFESVSPGEPAIISVEVNLYFPENDVSVIVLENQMNDNSAINYYFETEIRKIIEKSSLTNKQ